MSMQMSLVQFFSFFIHFGRSFGGCGLLRNDVVGMLSAIFLAEGQNINPQPNFLLVLMMALIVVISYTFSNNLS